MWGTSVQIDAQNYLDILEKENGICFWDIESTGLRGDYNSILVVSIKPFSGKPVTMSIVQPGNDQKLVRDVKKELEKYSCWVTYFGKGFDLKMLDTRLLKWKCRPVEKRHHIDLFFTLKHHLLTSRRSQGHLLRWLDAPAQKMGVSADEWTKILSDPLGEPMRIMRKRCESDVVGLEELYKKTRHLVMDIKRGI
jgi:hypothetical protein